MVAARYKKCLNCGCSKYLHDKRIARKENIPHPFNPPGGYRPHSKDKK